MANWKWKTYANTLDHVFRGYSNEEKMLNAHIMRVSVLYEDVRLENLGLADESIPSIDALGIDYRRMYFIRRSIATVREFAEAVPGLDACEGFQEIKSRFPSEERQMWDKSVAFFRRRLGYIEKIRNEFGGHFGFSPSWFAVHNLQPTGVALEYMTSRTGRAIQVRLKYAGEIVAIGMHRHKRGGTSVDHFRLMFRLVLAGFGHAARRMELLTLHYIEPRFRNQI